MTSKLGTLKTSICVAALSVAAVPLLAPAQAHAAGSVAITSGPGPIGQGARGYGVFIQGTGFATGAIARISGTGAWIKSPFVYSSTHMSGYATVASGATTGPRDLIVTNPDGRAATCAGCVTIDPAPVVTSIGSLEAGAGLAGFFPQDVTLLGHGFVNGLPRAFIENPQHAVAVWHASVVDSTHATVGIVVTPDATPGNFDVTFTNGDGGVGRCLGCFTVLPGPHVASMRPSTFIRGHTYTVTLSGRYFDQGATPFVLVLHGGITVSNVVVSSDGRTLTFDMAINAKTYLNGPGIFLAVRNPAPGYGSIQPIQLTVTKSCGTTTC
jgi:hypothetical protein